MAITPFPIRTPRELLEKAGREIRELWAESEGFYGEPNRMAVGDLAYNAACTLWHVTDWIANSGDARVIAVVSAKGCTTPDRQQRTYAFQNQLRSESDDLEICWALALHFKHFELEAESKARGVIDDDEAFLSAPVGHMSGAPIISDVGPPVDISSVGTPSVPEPGKSTAHAKVTSGGERLRLTDVYTRAYQSLDKLLSKHGL